MNPKNPYPHEISFDQHIWLPRANANYNSLANASHDRKDIQSLIENTFPEVRDPSGAHPPFVELYLQQALSADETDKVKAKCAELGWTDSPYDQLRAATHFFDDLREKIGLSAVNPPEHIHRMQRGECYVGDVYSANLIFNTLRRRDLRFENGKRYLDFGCSSGSLIRILTAVMKDASFFGVDPIESAIEWATANIPAGTFLKSELSPPLAFQDGFFDGVTAISIWSHLGEKEALRWFDEMNRCVKPGGWLLFTTHGRVSVSYYNLREMHLPKRILATLEGLLNSDFVFEETYLGQSPEGIDATGYGNAYLTREWVLKNLTGKWRMLSVDFGANQENQDVYLLRRM
ncbi:class I SAM-dependent methyltransferase [Mesorhizobium sp. M0293]|uniref:class I SAM-dependent methyltransferase n=1 Tax=Mesorhizobium sp. M0293 TaxID=2956930 RepID=UPI00333B4F14